MNNFYEALQPQYSMQVTGSIELWGGGQITKDPSQKGHLGLMTILAPQGAT